MGDERHDVLRALRESAESLGMAIGPVISPTEEMRAAAADRRARREGLLRSRSGTLPALAFAVSPKSRERGNSWDGGEDPLWLLTPGEVALLPEGTPLVGIDGEIYVKGIDHIDMGTRFGYTAHGLLESQINKGNPEEEVGDE